MRWQGELLTVFQNIFHAEKKVQGTWSEEWAGSPALGGRSLILFIYVPLLFFFLEAISFLFLSYLIVDILFFYFSLDFLCFAEQSLGALCVPS